MKKRIISMLGTMTMLCLLIAGNVLGVSAQDKEKIVDGSYLTDAEESRGTVSEDELLKAISKSGRGRIYAYGATTADHDVDYLAVLVYVDQYNEETGDWEQVYSWAKEAENTYYVSTEDARVSADLVSVTPQISGKLMRSFGGKCGRSSI